MEAAGAEGESNAAKIGCVAIFLSPLWAGGLWTLVQAIRTEQIAPAILGVGVYDFLYQDNMAYADLLKKAGNKLTFREFPTLNHGFFLLCEDLRRHLHG